MDTKALNFMIHHRGSKGAYDKWADEVGDDSYRLEALTPYFEKSVTLTPPNTEKRRANASTQYDPDAFTTPGGPVQVGYTNWVSVWATWLEKGLEAIGMERTTGFNSGRLMGYHYSQSTIRGRDQTRSTSAEYIYQASERGLENLKVYTQTMARKIMFDGGANKEKATGVRVSSLGIEYTIKARKEVILSAGTFQSPQLLMVSGIGPRATLDDFEIPVISDLPGVGQNMWDHIMFGPSYEVAFDTLDRVLHDPVVLAQTLAEYVATQSGPLTSNVVEFLGWEKLPAKYRDTFSPETRDALDREFPDDWPEVEHISGNGFIGDFTFPALQQPLDGKHASTLDLPRVSPNWLTAKADQEVAIAWYRRMREVWATDELKSVRVGTDKEYWPGLDQDTDAEILEVIRNSLMTLWHAAGTCKMGRRNDEMAVIDNEARVFDVEGLRVVDASSFPFLPPGHPQSTIYALAEKIADGIIKEG
ncbi:choline dehydrogenase [Apiospora saccharicola]|uniref:Choline dehydrogenase n=1 Tax=Apiospora saccharicola TaxID=335842 RepID=A0ABR1TLJ4_9PEZI